MGKQANGRLSSTNFLPGDIYSFHTSPLTKYSEADTGRFAALKVLAVDNLVTFVVLDGVFEKPPAIQDVAELAVLKSERFFCGGRPALHWAPIEWSIDLQEFRHLGNIPVTDAEYLLLPKLRGYGAWSTASSEAEGEWRWCHDRARVCEEIKRSDADRDAQTLAKRERYENRLKHLTWRKLLDEEPFARWDTSPPFPSAEFTENARKKIKETIIVLEAAGAKPKKRDVRAALRACVEWFNVQDQRFEHPIETEEREDICVVLGEIAFVARHPDLAEELHDWRTW